MVLRAANGVVALVLLLLLGCHSGPDWSFPEQGLTYSEQRYQVETLDQSLVVQGMILAIPEGGQWRWLWLDSFGMPVARMNLIGGQWHNDGFVAPNAQAQALFSALVYLVQPPQASTFSLIRIEHKDGRIEVGEMQGNQFVPFFSQIQQDTRQQEIVVYPSGDRYRLTELVNETL